MYARYVLMLKATKKASSESVFAIQEEAFKIILFQFVRLVRLLIRVVRYSSWIYPKYHHVYLTTRQAYIVFHCSSSHSIHKSQEYIEDELFFHHLKFSFL